MEFLFYFFGIPFILCILLIVAIKMIDKRRAKKEDERQLQIQKEAYKQAIKELKEEKNY